MHRPNTPVSLADLSAAGIRLRPYEAVTLVREIVLQVTRGEVAGLPSAHVIRLSSSGVVTVEGPVAAGGGSVARAAQLLDSLLPTGEGNTQFRVPGGLKLLVARALGTLDLPPIVSLEAFADALSRFGAADPAATIAKLAASWEESVAHETPPPPIVESEELPPPVPTAQVEPFVSRPLPALAERSAGPLTISDIRRARRATGLSLAHVSQRSRIPVALLRQLEWGYLLNWPGGLYGRTQLVRYARAAGLDEQLVVSTVAPLMLEAEARRSLTMPVMAAPVMQAPDEPVVDVVVTPVPDAPAVAVSPRASEARRRRLALAGLAIPAMVALGLVPGLWTHDATTSRHDGTTAQHDGTTALRDGASEHDGTTTQHDGTTGHDDTTGQHDGTTGLRDGTTRHDGTRAGLDGTTAPRDPATGREAAARFARTRGPALDEEGDPEAYRLTQAGVTYSPTFASAGTAVFYHTAETGPSSLVRADTDGEGSVLQVTRIVDDSASNFHVRPSPDGTRIAFDSDRDGVRGVYLADADGKNVRRVSPDGFAAVPSWSPDGTTLAFVRDEPSHPKVWNLWTLNLETGALTQLTRYRYGQPWGGSWFPDGKRIAYSHETRLVVLNLETGAEQVFKSPRGGLVRTPAVSPDGERIVFQLYHDGAWMLELSDKSMRRILDDPTAEEYAWSSDGTRIAYHSGKSDTWGVWVMAPRMARLSR